MSLSNLTRYPPSKTDLILWSCASLPQPFTTTDLRRSIYVIGYTNSTYNLGPAPCPEPIARAISCPCLFVDNLTPRCSLDNPLNPSTHKPPLIDFCSCCETTFQPVHCLCALSHVCVRRGSFHGLLYRLVYTGYVNTFVRQDLKDNAYKTEQKEHKGQGKHGYKAAKREYSLTRMGMDRVVELVEIRRKGSENGGKVYDKSYRLGGNQGMETDGVVGKSAKRPAKSGLGIDEGSIGGVGPGAIIGAAVGDTDSVSVDEAEKLRESLGALLDSGAISEREHERRVRQIAPPEGDMPMDRYTRQGWEKYVAKQKEDET